MKAVLTSLLFLLSVASLAQRQNVSGRISGANGPIPNVSVREVDVNHRVYNHTTADKNGLFSFRVRDAQHSLQFFAPGYRTFTHKMLGEHSFIVTLEARRISPYVGQERLLLKCPYMSVWCALTRNGARRSGSCAESMTAWEVWK